MDCLNLDGIYSKQAGLMNHLIILTGLFALILIITSFSYVSWHRPVFNSGVMRRAQNYYDAGLCKTRTLMGSRTNSFVAHYKLHQ